MNRKKIIIFSGGQSGTDRAALDYALKRRMRCGGWCPAGRMAEDGIIPERYPLQETESTEPEERTRKNVLESDGTLIIFLDEPDEGTAITLQIAKENLKPVYSINRIGQLKKEEFMLWIEINRIGTLNIAGPRESNAPGVYEFTLDTLKILFG